MTDPQPVHLRVQLTKRGMCRFLSHAEYSRTLMLAARRAGLPLAFGGMRGQRLKVSLSPPLPVGVSSECEFVDFYLTEYISPLEAAEAVGRSLPEGIEVVRCRLMGGGATAVGKLIDTASYRVTLPAEAGTEEDWRRAVKDFLDMETIDIERVQPRRTRTVDLRPGVHRIELEKGEDGAIHLVMVLDDGTRGTVKPSEVLAQLSRTACSREMSLSECTVAREGLYVRRGTRLVSPMDLAKGRPSA